jgi:membrane protease YdiL (CAAX protease family)
METPSFETSESTLTPTETIIETPRNKFFFGRFGLRAGWGMALFILFYLIATTIGQIFGVAASGQLQAIMNARTYAQAHPGEHQHVTIQMYAIMPILMDGVAFIAMLAFCWFASRAERRRLSVYGIGSYRWKDVFPGAFWGLAVMSLLIALLHGMHLLVFDGRALSGASIAVYGFKWLIAFILVGLGEEYAFRGYLQFTLMRGVWGLAEKISPANARPIAFWLATLLLSFLFLLAHAGNGGETHFGLFAVFLAGITFAYALWRTGSLWWAIGFHATWDWAQSFLFGVADSGGVSVGRLFITHPQGKPLLSGGTTGPEGSVLVILPLLATIIILRFTHRGTQPEIEQGPIDTSLPHEASAAS